MNDYYSKINYNDIISIVEQNREYIVVVNSIYNAIGSNQLDMNSMWNYLDFANNRINYCFLLTGYEDSNYTTFKWNFVIKLYYVNSTIYIKNITSPEEITTTKFINVSRNKTEPQLYATGMITNYVYKFKMENTRFYLDYYPTYDDVSTWFVNTLTNNTLDPTRYITYEILFSYKNEINEDNSEPTGEIIKYVVTGKSVYSLNNEYDLNSVKYMIKNGLEKLN